MILILYTSLNNGQQVGIKPSSVTNRKAPSRCAHYKKRAPQKIFSSIFRGPPCMSNSNSSSLGQLQLAHQQQHAGHNMAHHHLQHHHLGADHATSGANNNISHSALSSSAGLPMLGGDGLGVNSSSLASSNYLQLHLNSRTPNNNQNNNNLEMAQQQQRNSQQEPNMAALAASQFLSALGQLAEQMAATVAAAAAAAKNNSDGSNGLPTGLNLHANSHKNQDTSSSGLNGGGGQASPLIQRHHQLSASQHDNNNHHQNNLPAGSSPVLAATAMAVQLSAVVAAAADQQQRNHLHHHDHQMSALPLTRSGGGGGGSGADASNGLNSSPFGSNQSTVGGQANNSSGASGHLVHSIPHSHSHPSSASLLMNNPHYQTVRTNYSTRRYSRRHVGPEEAMADPAIRATAELKMPVVPKTILIVLRHQLTVKTAITLACNGTRERLRKGAIQKKLEAMFREPGAVDAFLNEWDHPNAGRQTHTQVA